MNPDTRKFWPCYGVEGQPERWPPHAYVSEHTGDVPDEAIPGSTPVRLLQAMLMSTRYQWEQDAQEQDIDWRSADFGGR